MELMLFVLAASSSCSHSSTLGADSRDEINSSEWQQ